jgi:cytoskeletal protein CcmA (bactofilin family)
MFKRNKNAKAKIDTLIGAATRINGDVEFAGGLHLDVAVDAGRGADQGVDLRLRRTRSYR